MSDEIAAELLSIGAFAQLTGLSIDALRHYHDIGLIEPAAVDRHSGYRRYHLDQARRAALITALRDLDMGLADIRSYLDAEPDRRLLLLINHRRRLVDRARAAAGRVEALDRLIEGDHMTTGTHAALREELLAMFQRQQAQGRELFDRTRRQRPDRFLFELPPDERPAGWQAVQRLATEYARRLDGVIEEHGWPGRTLVGDDGAAAAWAIAQHADDDNALRRGWLPRLAGAVAAGEVPGIHLAALTDRVRLRDGLAQHYGTVVEPLGDGWRLRPPIDEEAGIDERRRAIGLPPVAEFLASLPAPDDWYGDAAAS